MGFCSGGKVIKSMCHFGGTQSSPDSWHTERTGTNSFAAVSGRHFVRGGRIRWKEGNHKSNPRINRYWPPTQICPTNECPMCYQCVTHTHTKTSWGSNKQLPGVLHRVFVSVLPEKDFVPGWSRAQLFLETASTLCCKNDANNIQEHNYGTSGFEIQIRIHGHN